MIGVWLSVVFGVMCVIFLVKMYCVCMDRDALNASLRECRGSVSQSNARIKELESKLKEEVNKKCCIESSREAFKKEVERSAERFEKLQKQYDALKESKDYGAAYMESRAREWHTELESKETIIKSLEHRLSVAQKDREAFLSELTTAKSIIRNMREPVKEIEAAIYCMQESDEDSNA